MSEDMDDMEPLVKEALAKARLAFPYRPDEDWGDRYYNALTYMVAFFRRSLKTDSDVEAVLGSTDYSDDDYRQMVKSSRDEGAPVSVRHPKGLRYAGAIAYLGHEARHAIKDGGLGDDE